MENQGRSLPAQVKHENSSKIRVIDNLDHFMLQLPPVDPDKPKPVVLLYHGFLMSSEVWICNLDEHRNLPFLLAEKGYDVWMGNARGNKYSQSHLWRSPRHQSFWEFSINEFAMMDLPDTVDVRFTYWDFGCIYC